MGSDKFAQIALALRDAIASPPVTIATWHSLFAMRLAASSSASVGALPPERYSALCFTVALRSFARSPGRSGYDQDQVSTTSILSISARNFSSTVENNFTSLIALLIAFSIMDLGSIASLHCLDGFLNSPIPTMIGVALSDMMWLYLGPKGFNGICGSDDVFLDNLSKA